MIDKRVVELREARSWSRPRLAREAHITRDLIAKIERGQVKYPRLDTLCKLKHAFELETIDALVSCPDSTPDAA
jgi:transcriptional regulator with XRE-family HTH domain